jgi:hypothetical protein
MNRPACVNRASIGITSDNSPMPSVSDINSVMAPTGHPPPGSTASSFWNPVGNTFARSSASV